MKDEVERMLKEIEDSRKLKFEVLTPRPFVVVTIRNKKMEPLGAGVSCVQLPDPWDVEHGIRTAKIRAVKDYLGIPNPRLKNILAHEVSQARATG